MVEFIQHPNRYNLSILICELKVTSYKKDGCLSKIFF